MGDPVGEAERRLSTWRADHAAIASAVRARIDRHYAEAALAGVLAQVLADEAAQRAEGRRSELERTRWADVVVRSAAGAHADAAHARAAFRAVVDLYLDDIAGGFDRRLYRAVMAVLPRALDVAFRPLERRAAGPRFTITGPIERLRALAQDHTLVFAPTHSSNLDSLVVGLALRRSALPPCAYAAGKHMYRNAVLARLMAGLGAYRVDRGLAASLYKDVLKAYAAELLERGFHMVIFPGATRCRTNEVESQLKLGLLGTTLEVRRPIAIVPVTINYQVIVEAPTLIRHFLAGRSAERIGGDSPRGAGVVAALRRIAALDELVVVAFGAPLAVAPARDRGPDPARHLGAALTAAYRHDTVLFATHVVARALHELSIDQTGSVDIQQLVRRAPQAFRFPAVHARIARVVELIRAHRSGGTLAATIDPDDPEAMIAEALRAWAACHPQPVAVARNGELVVEDAGLVYFYRNRTAHLGS